MPDKIQLNTVALDVHANGTKQIFRTFARYLSPSIQYDYNTLIERLNTLESNDTAAVGDGIMVFHGWVDDWASPTTSFIRLKDSMEVSDAPDRQPIDLVLLLLSPKSDGPIHLARVSNLTRFIKQNDNANMIRGASTEDAVRAIFENIDQQKRAA
jgi:mannitol/fructose-specific phosphotransferase system IIA component (Ntr-type)